MNDQGVAIATNVGVIILVTLYYYSPGGPSSRQILNKEETATIFRMNVINANLRKKTWQIASLVQTKLRHD